MHISIIATDFDGTISRGDRLAPEVGRALRRWRETGRFTVLVSGRPFEFLHELEEREQIFDLIVGENGAVVYNPHTDEMRLPFGQVPQALLDTLTGVGVPLWRGVAIAGTRMPYDDAVWVASRELGLSVHVETNRNEVMILPPGVSKGAGLLNLLQGERLSPRNLLAFGDAENDCSLLQVAEIKVAVANAVQELKAAADYVTPQAGPEGVATFIERYLLDGKPIDFAVQGAHHFKLGTIDAINLNAHELVDQNILITGGSGYGKSWLATWLADGLVDGGYQLLGLDPVGDLRVLARHATCLCLGQEETPPMNLVVQLMAETNLNVVLDLSRLATPEEQILYVTGLLRRMLEVHRRLGKPHWLLVDEAQDLLGGQNNPARRLLTQSSVEPGTCLVTWQPSRLDETLLDLVNGLVLTRHLLQSETACLSNLLAKRGVDDPGMAETLNELGAGQALAWGIGASIGDSLVPLRFSVGPRAFSKTRRLHSYLEKRVAPPKQFYFHDTKGDPTPAGNLSELADRLRILDLDAVTFHFRRGDFYRWIRDVLHDERLALWLDRLHKTDLSGEALRTALLGVLEQRCRDLERLT